MKPMIQDQKEVNIFFGRLTKFNFLGADRQSVWFHDIINSQTRFSRAHYRQSTIYMLRRMTEIGECRTFAEIKPANLRIAENERRKSEFLFFGRLGESPKFSYFLAHGWYCYWLSRERNFRHSIQNSASFQRGRSCRQNHDWGRS